MNKHKEILFFLAIIMFTAINIFGSTLVRWDFESEQIEKDFWDDVNYLDESISNNNIEEFALRAAWIDEKWSEKSLASYLIMLGEITIKTRATNLNGDKKYEQTKIYYTKYISNLKKLDIVPLEYEYCRIRLNIHVKSVDSDSLIGTKNWEIERFNECSQYLDFYQALLSAYKPEVLSKENWPYIMRDPKFIEESYKRDFGNAAFEDYKVRYQINQEKNIQISYQSKIRDMISKLIYIQNGIGWWYSKDPYNPDELQNLLDIYVDDEQFRQKILNEVEQNRQRQLNRRKYQKDKARREAQEK